MLLVERVEAVIPSNATLACVECITQQRFGLGLKGRLYCRCVCSVMPCGSDFWPD